MLGDQQLYGTNAITLLRYPCKPTKDCRYRFAGKPLGRLTRSADAQLELDEQLKQLTKRASLAEEYRPAHTDMKASLIAGLSQMATIWDTSR